MLTDVGTFEPNYMVPHGRKVMQIVARVPVSTSGLALNSNNCLIVLSCDIPVMLGAGSIVKTQLIRWWSIYY
jgi:hypothetical protein